MRCTLDALTDKRTCLVEIPTHASEWHVIAGRTHRSRELRLGWLILAHGQVPSRVQAPPATRCAPLQWET